VVGQNAQNFFPKLFDVTEIEGIEYAQPLSQHPILRIHHNPGSKIIRVQMLGVGMPQVITMGMVKDAVGWNLLNELKQTVFVHGTFPKDFPQFHTRRKTEWLLGVTINHPCTR
jgi:hypothetical protein